MSLSITKPYLAGKLSLSFSVGSSAWRTPSREGNLYSTVAALLAAGDHPCGQFGNGSKGMEFLLRTVTATGTDGSGVGFKVDTTTTPSAVADAEDWVSGSGQQLSYQGPFTILWIYALAGTDTIKIDIRY